LFEISLKIAKKQQTNINKQQILRIRFALCSVLCGAIVLCVLIHVENACATIISSDLCKKLVTYLKCVPWAQFQVVA